MTPFAIVAPLLGPTLDRARAQRATLAALSCLARGVLCLLMARHIQSPWLYPEAFGLLVFTRSFQVTKSALVPGVVAEPHELVRANSRLTLSGVFGGAVAGAIALGVLRLGGPSWTLGVGAVVYFVATRLSFYVRPTRGESDAILSVDEAAVRLGAVRLAAIAMGALRWGVGFLVFLLAFALRREGEPAWFYGLVIAASSLGGLCGAVAAPRLRKALREEAVLVASLAVPAAIAVMGARSDARQAALMVAFAVGLGASGGRAGFDSLVQRDAPEGLWGRSFARYEAYFQLAWVLGAFVPVIAPMSAGTGLLLLALALGAGAFVYLAGLAADSLVGHERTSGR
jgi:hypothetical protein